MRYPAKIEKHVKTDEGDSICPDTACDLSCGCEWLRMRQTESLQVAIHAAKGTKSDGGSGVFVNMTS